MSTETANVWIVVTALITAIATIAVAFIAVFQDRIRSHLQRPVLTLSISGLPPDCQKVPLHYMSPNGFQFSSTHVPGPVTGETQAYYLRVRIGNEGNVHASLVEVIARELKRKQANGTFTSVPGFASMNLLWSYFREPYCGAISPDTYKYCDIAHIINPNDRYRVEAEREIGILGPSANTMLSFDTAVHSLTMSHLVLPGTYRLVLQVAASNARSITHELEITLPGTWFDDERQMLSDGVGVRVVQ
jgi:hypothetical protein